MLSSIHKILFALLLCLFTLPAIAENTILIIGDSISAAYGIDIQKGWVSLLKTRLQHEKFSYRVINASVTGDTTSNGLARLPDALQEYKPTITIVELGGNDGLRGLNITVIKHNLEKIIDLIQKANSKVLLLGMRLPPNYGPTYTQQFERIFTDLAERDDIAVVPFFLHGMEEKRELFQSDGIHPTEQAQMLLLDNVWPELKKML